VTSVILADATADATVALAALTFVLAVTSVVGIVFTRRALSSATDDTREATRARIDQQAPRIAIFTLGGEPSTLGWLQPLPSKPFDALDSEIRVNGTAIFVNEGLSTAMIELPSGVTMDELPPGGSRLSLDLLRDRGESFPNKIKALPLAPNESATVFVSLARTVQTWIDVFEQSETMGEQEVITHAEIKVSTTYQAGIVDTTIIECYSAPIRRRYDDKSKWDWNEFGTYWRTLPTHRDYPSIKGPRNRTRRLHLSQLWNGRTARD
jgi:hypothetical protein